MLPSPRRCRRLRVCPGLSWPKSNPDVPEVGMTNDKFPGYLGPRREMDSSVPKGQGR